MFGQQKFCVECLWYDDRSCHRDDDVNLITGEWLSRKTYSAYDERYRDGECGREGKLHQKA